MNHTFVKDRGALRRCLGAGRVLPAGVLTLALACSGSADPIKPSGTVDELFDVVRESRATEHLTRIDIRRGEYSIHVVDSDGDGQADRWELYENGVLRSKRWLVPGALAEAGEVYDDSGKVVRNFFSGHIREEMADKYKLELQNEASEVAKD
jgi:hypothetical protein